MAANGLGKGIVDAGGAVVEILGTYGFATTPAPTHAQLDAWVNAYNLNISTFIDADSAPGQTITAFMVRETTVIVKVPSMQIVWVDHGDITGTMPSSISAAATEMHMLLGK